MKQATPNPSVANTSKIHIALYNMGGPYHTEGSQGVETFLKTLFEDPDLISLPWEWLQKKVAKKIIQKRLDEVKERYSLLGGSSCQMPITQSCADQLWKKVIDNGLESRISGISCLFRYSTPRVADLLDACCKKGIEELWLMSQYPHCSQATTGTLLREVGLAQNQNNEFAKIKIKTFAPFHSHPDYITLWQNRIAPLWKQMDEKKSHILVSAHSVPVSFVADGDPYRDQIAHSVYNTLGPLGLRENIHWSLSWQSAVGPVAWLGPDTEARIHQLAKKGTEQILIWPPAFVCDHIETLHEIDIQFAEFAKKCGIKNFIRVPTFNEEKDYVNFIYKRLSDALVKKNEALDVFQPWDLLKDTHGEGCHRWAGGCVCGRFYLAGRHGNRRGGVHCSKVIAAQKSQQTREHSHP